MSDPNYNDKFERHRMLRGVARGRIHYKDNHVMDVTLQDYDFENSMDASKFMHSMLRPDKKTQCNQRRLKLQSIDSD